MVQSSTPKQHGFIIRNEDGTQIVARARSLAENTIFCGRRTLDGKGRGFKNACVESHSKLVIDAIKGSCAILWRLRNIIEDIKWLVFSFALIFWIHIYKEANFLVNAITSTSFHFNCFHVCDRSQSLWPKIPSFFIVSELVVIAVTLFDVLYIYN